MANIWAILMTHILAISLGAIAIIAFLIKEARRSIIATVLISVLLGCAILIMIVGSKEYIADLVDKKTTEIVAVYADASRSSTTFGATDIVFKIGDKKITLLAPRLERVPAKLKKGKLYKITYFNNTKIISKWVLLE